MKKVILKIGGMSCSACQNRVEKYLNKQEGVSASVNLIMNQALIEYDENIISLDDLNRFVKESGYESLGLYDEKEENKKDNSKYLFIVFLVLILLLMYISMSYMIGLPLIPALHMKKNPINYGLSLLILTIPFIIFGFDIIKSGITKLIHLNPNMDSLVTIGVGASFFYSLINLFLIIKGQYDMAENLYFESVAMIIYFIKVGRFIEKKSKEKTKDALKQLVQITPQIALLKTKEGEKEVTIDEVKKNDILICKPGMKIAVDGIIVLGEIHIDESFITGESIPSKKKLNDKVIAGSINVDGYIEYKALKIGPESTISEIVRLVVEASNSKAPIAKISDIISGYFVPGIIIIALLTFVTNLLLKVPLNEAIMSFVTVLVVACPCALGLATPIAIVISEGVSAKKGILIKSSETLENAHKIDTIIFDKTGTLTYGNLQISDIYNYSKYTDEEILNKVAALENKSTHPISTAFEKYYDKNIKTAEFKIINGIGLEAQILKDKVYVGNSKILDQLKIEKKYTIDEKRLMESGNSIVYVIENKNVIALIGVKDIIRNSAGKTIKELKRKNIDIIMLSGDNEKTANIVGKSLGIKNIVANILPQDKEKEIVKLKKEGHFIMMVGDGINDAPALTKADIGVSVNNASDIAGDSADVILTKGSLGKIVDLINISKKTIIIIKQNMFWAFFYNILMIPIAAGLLKPQITLSPVFASIAMTMSSLTVVFNSLRLRK